MTRKVSRTPQGLVVFDLDGTLFRGEGATVGAVWEIFGEEGLTRPDASAITAFYGRPTSEFQAWLSSLCPEGRGEKIAARIVRREVQLVPEKGELFAGVREALSELIASGRQIALCTNGDHAYVDLVLESRGIRDRFALIRHRLHDNDTKPGMLAEILGKLEARPAVMVGDRRDDVEAALHCGIPVIGAAYGYGSIEELAGSDRMIDSVGDLVEAVRELMEQDPPYS